MRSSRLPELPANGGGSVRRWLSTRSKARHGPLWFAGYARGVAFAEKRRVAYRGTLPWNMEYVKNA